MNMRYIIEEVKNCSDCPYLDRIGEDRDEPWCDNMVKIVPTYPEIPDTCPLPKEKP
jgi:hypothetical protein